MVTCYLRYVIDPSKVKEFEHYSKIVYSPRRSIWRKAHGIKGLKLTRRQPVVGRSSVAVGRPVGVRTSGGRDLGVKGLPERGGGTRC